MDLAASVGNKSPILTPPCKRLCGAFCKKHQGRVFRTDDSLWRRCVAEQLFANSWTIFTKNAIIKAWETD
jgi:hypothetical protein